MADPVVICQNGVKATDDTSDNEYIIEADPDGVTVGIDGSGKLEAKGRYKNIIQASGGFDLLYTSSGALVYEISGSGTIKLPPAPADGDWYDIRMIATGATETIDAGTNTIESGSSTRTIGTSGGSVRMIWVASWGTWIMMGVINVS